MHIFEYYRKEINDNDTFNCLEARWDWELEIEEQKPGNQQDEKESDMKKWCLKIKWIDMFEKEPENIIFTCEAPIETTSYWGWKFSPRNRHYGLIHLQDLEQRPQLFLFWPIEFCWESRKCKIGEIFESNKEERQEKWCVLADKKVSSKADDLHFLLYAFNYSTHLHFLLNTKTLQIKQLGSYELPLDNFNCLCLNGSIIFGLSYKSKSIHRFDREKKEFLSPIKVNGWSSEDFRYLRYASETGSFAELRTLGAWSSDSRQVFVWTEIKAHDNYPKNTFWVETDENKALRSTIYRISLYDNKAECIPLDHVFHQTIGRLFVGPDDKTLYVRNDEFIGRGYRREDGVFEFHDDEMQRWVDATRVHHFYRLSIGRPESLMFLATATVALSKSQNLKFVDKVLDKSEEQMPRHIYEQVEY